VSYNREKKRALASLLNLDGYKVLLETV
jgi:hypothetical protein